MQYLMAEKVKAIDIYKDSKYFVSTHEELFASLKKKQYSSISKMRPKNFISDYSVQRQILCSSSGSRNAYRAHS